MINAREYAIQAHGDQKYGDEPYVNHLDEVVQVLKDFGFDDEVWIARGYLHDVLEDTYEDYEILESKFGRAVIESVYAVSGFGLTRKIRNADIKEKLRIYGADAQILKIADRIANCERGAKNDMYREEYESFAESVHLAPRAMRERLKRALRLVDCEE